jgi:hypothetical protein
MATIKTTSSDYTVNLGPYDSGNAKWAGTMNVNGNLNVAGHITYVTDLAVNDAFIIVAANNTGTVQDMGLIATKGTSSYAGLRFNVASNVWQVSSSVTAGGVSAKLLKVSHCLFNGLPANFSETLIVVSRRSPSSFPLTLHLVH